MAVHIGEEIARILKDSGMTKTTFAERVGRDRTRINDLLEAESVDTRLLFKIGKVLRHNFFKLLSEDFEPAPPTSSVASEPAPNYKKPVRAPIRMVFEIDPDDPLAAKQAEAIAKGVLAAKKKK